MNHSLFTEKDTRMTELMVKVGPVHQSFQDFFAVITK